MNCKGCTWVLENGCKLQLDFYDDDCDKRSPMKRVPDEPKKGSDE